MRRGLPILLAVLALLAQTACAPQSAVNPTQADQAVRAIWPHLGVQVKPQARLAYEAGTLLAADKAQQTMNVYWLARPRSNIYYTRIFLYPQTSYPLSFVAEVESGLKSNPERWVLVMTEESSGSRWQASALVRIPGYTELPAAPSPKPGSPVRPSPVSHPAQNLIPRTDSDGYANRLESGYVYTPQQVPAAIVAHLDYDVHHPGQAASDRVMETRELASVPNQLQVARGTEANSSAISVSYPQQTPLAYPLQSGGLLVVFQIGESMTVSAAKGCLTPDPKRPASWWALSGQSKARSAILHADQVMVAYDPQGQGQIVMLGEMGSLTSAQSQPCP